GVLEVAGAIAGYVWLALPPLPDVKPARYWPEPNVVAESQPDAGPVLVTVEWRIDPANAQAFAAAMTPLRLARRQTGATRWGLFHDTAEPSLFLETFTVATWSEHMRQHLERGTEGEQKLDAHARSFLAG